MPISLPALPAFKLAWPHSVKTNSLPPRRFFQQTVQQNHKLIQLEPGLIHIKGGLSLNEQKLVANLVLEKGARPKQGFWTEDKTGHKVLNSTDYRGRMFSAVTEYPKVLTDLVEKNLALASQVDSTLKPIRPTHAIVLYYQTLDNLPPNGYMGWHQDNGENDGEADYPVVSFAIGDSCDFLVNYYKPKTDSQHPRANPSNLSHRVLFESGDVLIFGGPCRLIWHAIYHMHPQTAPHDLPLQNARLNLTFRYTPKLIGDEARFATVPAKELAPDNQFYQLSKMRK